MAVETLFPIRIDRPQDALNLCFTLTTRCNLNCAYCFNREALAADMSPELAYRLYNAYARMKAAAQQPDAPQAAKAQSTVSVILFGGEPTLNHPAIQAITRAAQEQGHRVLPRLVTNGVIAEALLDRLIEEGYYFQVSYDRVSAARMGEEKEEIVLRTIQKVSHAGLPLFLRSTIHAGNVEQMAEIIRDAQRFGADAVGFAPLALMGSAVKNAVARPSAADYVDNYLRALDLALELGINVYSAEINYLSKRGRASPAPTLVFLPDGSISYSIKYCSVSAAGARDLLVGRYDPETEALVFDRERIEQRARIFAANQPGQCGACSALAHCRGLNLFDILSIRENPGKVDSYYCEITRELLKRLEGKDLKGNVAY
jgi:MoaA/NifB/PqqE/SkfB family radical SAM enzyme